MLLIELNGFLIELNHEFITKLPQKSRKRFLQQNKLSLPIKQYINTGQIFKHANLYQNRKKNWILKIQNKTTKCRLNSAK